MSQVRAFTRADIPSVAKLRRRAFSRNEQSSIGDLEAYIEAMFFDSPFADHGAAGIVEERVGGGIAGFVGILGRSARYGEQTVRYAVATQLLVDPQLGGGLTALNLLRGVFAQPFDLVYSDMATSRVRRIWQQAGGESCALSSLQWTKPLQTDRHALQEIQTRLHSRGIMLAAKALVRLVPQRTAPDQRVFNEHPLDISTMISVWSATMDTMRLQPVYDEESIRLILRELHARKKSDLKQVCLTTPQGEVAGWFIYYLLPGGQSQVVQLFARSRYRADVLKQLFIHAKENGSTSIGGTVTASLLPHLENTRCLIRREGPWTLAASKRTELLLALHRGQMEFSRLDGEWWLRF